MPSLMVSLIGLTALVAGMVNPIYAIGLEGNIDRATPALVTPLIGL